MYVYLYTCISRTLSKSNTVCRHWLITGCLVYLNVLLLLSVNKSIVSQCKYLLLLFNLCLARTGVFALSHAFILQGTIYPVSHCAAQNSQIPTQTEYCVVVFATQGFSDLETNYQRTWKLLCKFWSKILKLNYSLHYHFTTLPHQSTFAKVT